MGGVAAIEGNAAGARREEAEYGFKHGRFAGPVRTDHRRDGAAPNARAHAVQNGHLAVAGEDAVQTKERLGAVHALWPPRYASITTGLRRISCGVPCAMMRPSAKTSTRVHSAMTNSIWCSITTKVALRSA